jgi:hypothetical protein
MTASDRTGRRLALALVVLVGAALTVSVVDGAPDRLPGVALGSEVLLHAERAAAIFAIVVAVVSVLAQATRGRLPTQLSTAGLAYEADAAADAKAAVEDLQAQVDDLQDGLDRLGTLVLGEQEPQS